MRNERSNGIGTHIKSAPRVMDHVEVSGFGKGFSGRKTESGTGTHIKSAPRVMDHVEVSGFGKGFSGRKTESGTGLLGLAVLLSRSEEHTSELQSTMYLV